MHIRKALESDSERLSQIAFASKAHWNYPETWLSEWRPQLTISAAYIVQNEVYVAKVDDQIAGFYALQVDGDTARLDHLWLDPQSIGAGFGRALYLHAIDTARSRKCRVVNIDSEPNAEGFYSKMGASRVGEVYAPVLGSERYLPLMRVTLD